MNCRKCGKANMHKGRATIPGELKGERFTVSMEGLVCPKCGYTTVVGPHMAEYMRLVSDAYRSKHGLLTSEEIRARRARFRMSQAAFAEYLGVGIASLKRWEMGKVQDSSSEKLIRLRTDESEASRNLARIRESREPWRQIDRALGAEVWRKFMVDRTSGSRGASHFVLPFRWDSNSGTVARSRSAGKV